MHDRQSETTGLTSTAGKRGLVLAVFLALVGALLVTAPPLQAQAACSGNAIVCENELPGSPASEWDIEGVGDTTHSGFRDPNQCERRIARSSSRSTPRRPPSRSRSIASATTKATVLG